MKKNNKSQAYLERQLAQRQLQVAAEMMTPEEAFSHIEEWTTELGGRKAFLHPQYRQWLWHDQAHDEWVFAECGVDEGILLTIGNIGGVKKLSKPENIANWCIWMENDKPHGPLPIIELRQKLDAGELSADIQVWSPRSLDWFTADSEEGERLIYSDFSEDETILRGR